MTDQVIIKKVKSLEIWLTDSDIDEFSWNEVLTKSTIIATASIILGYLFAVTYQLPLLDWSTQLGTLICFIILTIVSFSMGAFYIIVPAYRVSTNGDIDSIFIKKTTEEADQIAICKAATEIECQIKAKAENLQKLKQMAEKCK